MLRFLRRITQSTTALLVVTLFCLLPAIAVALNTFINPLHRSSADFLWAAFYTIAILGAALLWRLRRNRLLFRLTVAAVGLLLLIVIVFSDNGPALFALAWLILLAVAIGNKLLDWIRLPLNDSPVLERFLFAEGLGMASLAVITLALASARTLQGLLPLPDRLFRLLHPVPVFALLVGLSIILLPGFLRSIRPWMAESVQRFKFLWQSGGSGLVAISLSTMVVCGLAGLLLALAPSIRYDALSYHLSVPARYIEAGGMIPMPETWNSFWAHYAEMFYTLTLLIAGQPLPGLLHYSFGVLTTGLVFAFARRLGGPRMGVIAALLFFSLPIVNYEAATAYIDLFQAFYTFGAVYAVVMWWQEKRDPWLLVSGVFAGFALGIKVSAVAVIGPLAMLVVILLLFAKRPAGRKLAGILLFGLPALLVYAPWPIRDYLWTGNPIFPMYNHIFKSPLWTYGYSIFSLEAKPGSKLWTLLKLPWDMVFDSSRYYWDAQDGMLGAITLLGLPWIFPWVKSLDGQVRRIALALLALVVVSFTLFFFTSPNARYMMPLYAIIAVLAALNIESVLSVPRSEGSRKAMLVLALSLTMVYLLSTRLALTVRSLDIDERYPVKTALGFEEPNDFLSRSLDVYDTFQYLNRTTRGNPEVLTIGTDYLYYTRAHIYPYMLSPEAVRLAEIDLPLKETAAALVEKGFNYLLVDWNGVRAFDLKELPVLDLEFLNQYTTLEYANNNIYAYRILPEGRSALGAITSSENVGEANLLANAGFEIGAGDPSFAWEQNGVPGLDQQTLQPYQGSGAVQVTGSDFLYQQVMILPGELYTLGYWMRAVQPDQDARLQIMWRDENLITVDVAAYNVSPGSDWTWWQISDVAPESAEYARIYITAEDGSQIWVDDAVFVQGEIINP